MAKEQKQAALVTAYKCTRADGTDFRTGTINYAGALASGKPIKVDAGPPTGRVCGRGLHVSPTLRDTIRYASCDQRPWRWFEVVYWAADEIERDTTKMRVRRIERVVRELALEDLFGADIALRARRVSKQIKAWKTIPWFRPARAVPDARLAECFGAWHAAISHWLPAGTLLPKAMRVVRDLKVATAAAIAVATATEAAAAADAAAALAVTGAAIADATGAAATGVATEAAAAALAADDDAAADAADEAATLAAALGRRVRWYVRPFHTLQCSARWQIVGIGGRPDPWGPLVEVYRLGCWPIGYSGGEFVIYAPGPGR